MTKLEYLENTYLFESKAQIINSGKNEFGEYLILDKTIFYPQGGGQPYDIGEILIGENTFEVNNVRIDENGIVFHYGKFLSEDMSQDLISYDVILNVNSENRIINSKNHTAGHLIDIAMTNIGTELESIKGFHFKEGSYVEYSGLLNGIKIDIITELNLELEKLISQDLKVIIENGENNINSFNSPEGKNFRFVYFEGYKNLGCGCGGTHIKNTLEIGKINIRKLREKKGIVKISYEIIQ